MHQITELIVDVLSDKFQKHNLSVINQVDQAIRYSYLSAGSYIHINQPWPATEYVAITNQLVHLNVQDNEETQNEFPFQNLTLHQVILKHLAVTAEILNHVEA
ncbi:hypothetical protein D3C75_751430 [compost metagenome]